MNPARVYFAGDVAKIIGVKRARMGQLIALGRLRPFAVSVRGTRIFDRDEVERLVADRQRRGVK